MSQLYFTQKKLSLAERFTVFDEAENPRYYVEGSFMQIPKTFRVTDADGHDVASITKKPLSWLPTFFVEVDGEVVATIRQEFSLLKPRYAVDGPELSVQGNLWQMRFAVLHQDVEVARIRHEPFSWGDAYEVSVLEESLEKIVVSLVIAIDRVRATQTADGSAASM